MAEYGRFPRVRDELMAAKPLYKRVMIKISGEGLMGDREFGLDGPTVARIAQEIRAVVDTGIQVCLVIGGGNIFRGIKGAAEGMEPGRLVLFFF